MSVSIGFSAGNTTCKCKHEGTLDIAATAGTTGLITWHIRLSEVLLCNTDPTAHGWRVTWNHAVSPIMTAEWKFKKVCGPCTRWPCGGAKNLHPMFEKSGVDTLAACPKFIKTFINYSTNNIPHPNATRLSDAEARGLHGLCMEYFILNGGAVDPYLKACSQFSAWCKGAEGGGTGPHPPN